jgi:hypothetical protein
VKALRDYLLAPPAGAASAADRVPPPRSPGAAHRPIHAAGAAVDHAPAAAPAGGAVDRAPAAAPAGGAVLDHAPGAAPAVAVLAPPRQLRALGGATALLLARRAGAQAALVVLWAGEGALRVGPAAPARPAARRLAASLAGRGLDAAATGALVFVGLPADPLEAAVHAARALAAARGAPAVVALAGRHRGLDALLGDQDRVIVATPPGAERPLRDLAVAGMTRIGREARACEADPPPVARALAAAGLAATGPLRRALGPALDGLGR